MSDQRTRNDGVSKGKVVVANFLGTAVYLDGKFLCGGIGRVIGADEILKALGYEVRWVKGDQDDLPRHGVDCYANPYWPATWEEVETYIQGKVERERQEKIRSLEFELDWLRKQGKQ